MHPLGDDAAARLSEAEGAPLEERAARYLMLHAELLSALEAPAVAPA